MRPGQEERGNPGEQEGGGDDEPVECVRDGVPDEQLEEQCEEVLAKRAVEGLERRHDHENAEVLLRVQLSDEAAEV
jgi:hypothetical protein